MYARFEGPWRRVWLPLEVAYGALLPPLFFRIPWCRLDEAERLLRRDSFSVPRRERRPRYPMLPTYSRWRAQANQRMHFRLAIRHVEGSTGQPCATPLAAPLPASCTSRPTATPSTTHRSSLLSAKMTVFYSIDSAICTFFASSTTATRQQRDALASSLAGGSPVSPVAIQGSFRYTLTVRPMHRHSHILMHFA